MEEEILEILKKGEKDEIFSLMSDIIRVLIVSHGVCWLSELYIDLIKFYNFLGEKKVIKPKLIKNAIKKLEEMEVINIEKKERGFINKIGTYNDLLIRIIDMKNVKNALMKDKIYVGYTSYRHRKILEAIRK